MTEKNSNPRVKQISKGTLYIQGHPEVSGTIISGTISGISCTPYFSDYLFGASKTPKVSRVEFHNKKATVVYFDDGTVERSVVGDKDVFNPEMGYAMCLAKKYMGSYEKFAWSLNKAKHYENGEKVKKNSPLPKAGITVEEVGKNIKKMQEEMNKKAKNKLQFYDS